MPCSPGNGGSQLCVGLVAQYEKKNANQTRNTSISNDILHLNSVGRKYNLTLLITGHLLY